MNSLESRVNNFAIGNDFSPPASTITQSHSLHSLDIPQDIAYLPDWPIAFESLPRHAFDSTVRISLWGNENSLAEFGHPQELRLEEHIQAVTSPFLPLDVYDASIPSCPSSESSPSSEVSFPGLDEMRSGGRINGTRELVALTDPSREDRKLQRRRERNRASQRAFRQRKDKYVQELETHYMELRQRYRELLELVKTIRSDMGGRDNGSCIVQNTEECDTVLAATQFEI